MRAAVRLWMELGVSFEGTDAESNEDLPVSNETIWGDAGDVSSELRYCK